MGIERYPMRHFIRYLLLSSYCSFLEPMSSYHHVALACCLFRHYELPQLYPLSSISNFSLYHLPHDLCRCPRHPSSVPVMTTTPPASTPSLRFLHLTPRHSVSASTSSIGMSWLPVGLGSRVQCTYAYSRGVTTPPPPPLIPPLPLLLSV